MARFVDGPRIYHDAPDLLARAGGLAKLQGLIDTLRANAADLGVTVDYILPVLPEMTLRVPPQFTMSISNPVQGERSVTVGKCNVSQDGMVEEVTDQEQRTISNGDKFFADRLEIVQGEVVAIGQNGTDCRIVDPAIDWIEYVGD